MPLHRRTTARTLLAVPAALAVLLLTPALAAANVDYVSLKARDIGASADGVVGPGDLVALTVTAHNANAATPATNVSATITSSSGASVVHATGSLGDIPPDQDATNSNDQLVIQLPASPAMACGDVVHLGLLLAADDGTSTNVSVDVATGVPGAWTDHVGPGATIADAGVGQSNLTVDTPGTVRDVRVRVNDLQGPSVDDLQLRLVAPGSSAIVLPAHRIAGGTQFTNTTFSTRGQSISTASPPYTGTFLAPELAGVIGSSLGGVWTLQVSDRTKGADGTPPSILGGWTLQTAEASCDPQLVARVSASTPIASPGAAVTFDASESTSPTVDSADLTYDWTVDGQEVLGGGPQITQSFLTRGVHTVSVSVSDGVLSEPATDQVTIAVSQPPVPAFMTAPASPATGDTVSFDASASADPDPAGSIASYQWDFDGDGTWDLTTASPTTPHVYLKSGTYQVRLGVTNDLGARATKVLPVTVANRPPVADFTAPAPAIRTAAAHFDASAASDPDGQVELYSWDWNGDGVYDENTTSPGVDHTFAADGSVAVGLKVTDDEGATASTTRSVTVTDAPTVTLAADPESGRPGDVVTLSATAADPDGAPGGTDLTYAWDLDGQGGFEVPDSASPTTTTTFSTFADHVVRVRVTDAAGATAIASTTVKIVNNPPVPVLTATPNPVVAGQPVTFDASGSSDADGPIAVYRFDLDGDGTYEVTTTDPVVSRSYPNAGRFTVRLQVADSDDARRATTLDLVVQDPPPPPPPPPPAGGGTGGDGSAGTGGSGGGGGYGGSSEPTGPFVPVLGGAPIQSLKAALKVGVGVLLKLDRTAGMTLRATVQPAEARRLGLTKARGKKARPVLVGKLSVVAAPAGERRFTLKLVSSVRKRLAKARRMTVVLDARVDDGKGHVVPLTRVVLLRR